MGDKECALIREMTKMYEEVKKDTIENLITYFKDKKIRGEITAVINNRAGKYQKS